MDFDAIKEKLSFTIGDTTVTYEKNPSKYSTEHPRLTLKTGPDPDGRSYPDVVIVGDAAREFLAVWRVIGPVIQADVEEG